MPENWPIEGPMNAWAPETEEGSSATTLLAVPIPQELEVLDWEAYQLLLAKRVQWMVDEGDLGLSEMLNLMLAVGEMPAVDAQETAGEQILEGSGLLLMKTSELVEPNLPVSQALMTQENKVASVTAILETDLEAWILELDVTG